MFLILVVHMALQEKVNEFDLHKPIIVGTSALIGGLLGGVGGAVIGALGGYITAEATDQYTPKSYYK